MAAPSPRKLPGYVFILLQSKLNCETLHPDLGLELRWSLTEDNQVIILQLVSRTGSDRYLAFGIREQDDQELDMAGVPRMIGGDVVVGWINAKSGKGGLDDYFLAGDGHECEDGAESCPDSSKQVNKMSTKN